MQRGFGGTVFEPVQQPERRDRELTLGPVTLTVLGFGLFALCGLCFVFGYAVGHRNAETSTAISVPPPTFVQPVSAQAKPAAGQSGAQQASADTRDPSANPETSTGAAAGVDADPSASSASSPAAPAAQAALVPASETTAPPAAGQGNIMVQIAAVSHPEDADVLVGALRKRGYAVNSRRDPADGLLHVQIGPFANRSDAYAMRQKLLNDGYNAMVQQ